MSGSMTESGVGGGSRRQSATGGCGVPARFRWLAKAASVVAFLAALACTGPALAIQIDFSVFNDRHSYSGVLQQQGRVQVDADWNEAGTIQNGQPWGLFRFAFDPGASPLAGVPGIAGGLAIGSGTGDGVLGGDQGFALRLSPGLGVNAFGVLVAFDDPAFADDFRLVVRCPDAPCIFTPTLPDAQPAGPGTFFLGVIAQSGLAFDTVTLEAVTPRDELGEPIATVPGWQVTGISYAQVPEPPTLMLLGLAGLGALGRRRRRAGRGDSEPSRATQPPARRMRLLAGLLVWGMAATASATSLPAVQVRDTFEGVFTTIVDAAHFLDGQLSAGGRFQGSFRYTSVSPGADWTTFKQSDPGLTLVELFAFLGENLLYRANRIPEQGRPSSLTLALTEGLHVVEPCGAYLASPLTLPFELCLRLEFFDAAAPAPSTPTSVFDLAQWDSGRFFLYPMGELHEPLARFDEAAAGGGFLLAGSITRTTTSVMPIPEPGTMLLLMASGMIVATVRRTRRLR